MRSVSATLAGVLLLAALTACATPPGDASPEPAPPATGDGAIGLVNLWRVSGAEGEQPETWLRLDAGEFQLWRACGMIQGSWSATESLFIASIFGASGDCASGGEIPPVSWLDSVAGYRSAADGWALLDRDGATVAELRVDGHPEPIPTAAEFYTQPPEITDAVRDALAPAAPLPAGLEPADGELLLGRWLPSDVGVGTDAHVEFHADGRWTGSDGCNGGSGAWVADAAGGLLTTSGVSTLIGCDGAMVPSWVASARSAGLLDNRLSLFDADGNELGWLQRG